MIKVSMFETEAKQDAFLEKFKISREKFAKATISWSELSAIEADYKRNKSEYTRKVKACARYLQKCEYVHSLNYRLKKVDHLIEKIIRKNPDRIKKGTCITASNYGQQITDLMGVRVVLLYKDNWPMVHDYIMKKYGEKLHEPPFAYVVDGDDTSHYDAKGVKVVKSPSYRSVHYLIEEDKSCIEIQVRTLAEEVWGEIDHSLRYPYNKSNQMLGRYMELMADMAASIDRMATFVCDYLNSFEKDGLFFSKDVVYNNILSELDKIEGNESVTENIRNMIKSAEEYQVLIDASEVIEEILDE